MTQSEFLHEYESINEFIEQTKDKVRGYSLSQLFNAVVLSVCLIFATLILMVCSAHAETGSASYYTFKSCRAEGTSGYFTASGERFDENAMTCAMRSRAWGKHYRVTNLDNGKSVIVRNNDFGPNKRLHKQGRIIDLSKGAFQSIADLKKGIIKVSVVEI